MNCQFKKMSDMDLTHQRVLIREDFNVPIENGKITNDERILRALPTLHQALQQNAAVMILSHLGRPKEGEYDAQFSLEPVAESLSKHLKKSVPLIKNWLNGIDVKPGDIVLCENVRFNRGESENDSDLSQKMAKLCDVFVMDAFATAHRAQASTVGVAQYAPIACAGPLLVSEIEALTRATQHAKKPVIAVVGGSKVSTKIDLLKNLLDKVDQLIVGGGIANTFLKSQGIEIGKSLVENDWLPKAQEFWTDAQKKRVSIPLPKDVVVAKELSKNALGIVRSTDEIQPDESIFDVGPQTAASYSECMKNAGTIIWNGPVGVFEIEAFSHGTEMLANAIAESSAFSLAGGGDTLAALDKFGVSSKISYISTGGGAFLEFLEGKALPALEILERRALK